MKKSVIRVINEYLTNESGANKVIQDMETQGYELTNMIISNITTEAKTLVLHFTIDDTIAK